ncbi:cholesterol esterase [Sinomonas cellulolyticus]|jgi:hypothetical protein|uniref:Cholesterol esterase n=1 Tax=Sinomonas cellulolyticus TaxID=2801916 RepID=A0ABS1JZF5_9MICC|nr:MULTISPECIES: DUF6230 family protein [Sinomonas]MBL0704789.1 cholesterol esterase [Sinomonas cellulolyticus]GHG47063.1 cholesterol esterase [Sinomonas sp. KCTC 49339]
MKFPVSQRVRAMSTSRAGRITLAAVPTAVAAAVLMGGVAEGAVPVSFAVSGSQFKISADKLDGSGFSQYAGVAKDASGSANPVAIANIKSASLANLCQSVVTQTPMGTVGLLIHAGGGNSPATASDLQIGMTGLQGDASFSNIRIGVDASTVNTAAKGAAGDFAQDADTVTIGGLKQTAWSTQASVFNLSGMKLELTNGTECF